MSNYPEDASVQAAQRQALFSPAPVVGIQVTYTSTPPPVYCETIISFEVVTSDAHGNERTTIL